MKHNRKIALLSLGMLVTCVTYAQDGAKAKDVTSTRVDKTTILTTERKDPPFTSEKKVNDKTVQQFTREQFEKLPKERREYYLSHPGTYEIIEPKSN